MGYPLSSFKQFILCLMMLIIAFPIWSSNSDFLNVWVSSVVNGHVKPDSPYYYQFGTHIRMSDGSFLIRQNLERLVFGKAFNESSRAEIGYDFIPTRYPLGFLYEQRVFQQIDVKKQFDSGLSTFLFNRLEQRWVNDYSGVSLRNRLKFLATTCQEDSGYCFSAYSETFFNLNTTIWDPLKSIAQQWSYIGLRQKISKKTFLQYGYMNQYLFVTNVTLQFDIIDIQIVHQLD
jgi:Protein of unknown function (DUF2490)